MLSVQHGAPPPAAVQLAIRGAEVAALNAGFHQRRARDVLRYALSAPALGEVALVSSFGADAAVLLHMVSEIAPRTPVIFVETGFLFSETLTYQQELSAHLGLTELRVHRAPRADVAAQDPRGTLHRSQPDACCALRKVAPLQEALSGFDAWISGRKRHQGGARAGLERFTLDQATGQIKINPLAHWSARDVSDYMDRHALPRHPLVARGFASIGCAPCTSPTRPGEDPRAGRWRGQDKTECGIHFENGRVVRPGSQA